MDDITKWFENEKFVSELITHGLQALSQLHNKASVGLVEYQFDRRFEIDAKLISRLVRDHNARDKA